MFLIGVPRGAKGLPLAPADRSGEGGQQPIRGADLIGGFGIGGGGLREAHRPAAQVGRRMFELGVRLPRTETLRGLSGEIVGTDGADPEQRIGREPAANRRYPARLRGRP